MCYVRYVCRVLCFVHRDGDDDDSDDKTDDSADDDDDGNSVYDDADDDDDNDNADGGDYDDDDDDDDAEDDDDEDDEGHLGPSWSVLGQSWRPLEPVGPSRFAGSLDISVFRGCLEREPHF